MKPVIKSKDIELHAISCDCERCEDARPTTRDILKRELAKEGLTLEDIEDIERY